jgi:hypothetical protein
MQSEAIKLNPKPFEQSYFDEHEKYEYLSMPKIIIDGYEIKHNTFEKAIDLVITTKDGRIAGAIDIESKKRYWKTDGYFPFKSVHFFQRKGKYAVQPNSFYIIVSEDLSQAVMIPIKKMLLYPIVYIKTDRGHVEAVHDVPNKDCVWGWNNINKAIGESLKCSWVQKKLDD